MSIKQSRLWPHSTPYPCQFFVPPDMVAVDMTVSTGQLAVTSQVPTQVTTIPNVNTTYPSVTNISTNQGASGHPTCHEWVWIWLEGQSGCSSGLAWMEYCPFTLIMHQELGVMPLRIQWLSHQDVLVDMMVRLMWSGQLRSYPGWNSRWEPHAT